MRLYLLLILLSLVLPSSQRKVYDSEVYADLQGGLPVGSLLTIYVKYTAQPSFQDPVKINFYENITQNDNYYHFQLHTEHTSHFLISNTHLNGNWKPADERFFAWGPEVDWWRFDLYKISDTQYLPFLHGFNAHIRTLDGIKEVSSVNMFSFNPAQSNFDKDEAFMNFRLPSKNTPKPETVLAALDPAEVGKDLSKRTPFIELPNFPVGSKMKLSALMLASPANSAYKEKNMDKFYSTLLFLNPTKTWAFGMYNKYSEADKKVKFYLFVDPAVPAEGAAWPTDNSHWPTRLPTWTDCTGTTSSTDMVHVKLERPVKNIIKMRVYYNGSPAGITCQLTIKDEEVANLDGPLKAYGVQGATLLHINV